MRSESNEVLSGAWDKPTASLRITESSSTFQDLIDIDNNPVIYEGQGAPGLATSDDGWLITKYDLTSSPYQIQTAIGIWDNRASLTYGGGI